MHTRFSSSWRPSRSRRSTPRPLIAQATARAADTAWLTAVYAEGTAAYVDLAPVAAPAGFGEARDAGLAAAIAAADPSAESDADRGRRSATRPPRAPPACSDTVVADLGKPEEIGSTFAASVDALVPALGAAASLKDLLADELLVIEDTTISLAMESDGTQRHVHVAASGALRRVQRRDVPRLLGRRG